MKRQGMDWEAELRRLASSEAHISLPNAREIESALYDIEQALGSTAKEGLEGTAADAAAAAFDGDARDAMTIRDDVRRVMNAVDRANERRLQTADAQLRDLESGFPEKLDWWEETLLRGAAVGTTWALGPFSFTVADGVVGEVNELLAAQRHARAREGVQAVSAAMDEESASFTSERRVVTKRSSDTLTEDPEDYTPSDGGGPGDGGGGPGTSSFDTYPQDPSGTDLPPGFTYNPPTPDDGGDDPLPPTFPNPTQIGTLNPPYVIGDPPDCPVYIPDDPTLSNPDDPTWVNPNDPTWQNPDDVGPWSPDGPTAWLPDSDYPPGYDPNDPSTWGTGGRGVLTSDSSMGGGSHGWGSARTGTGVGALGSGSGSGVGGSGAFGGVGSGGAGSAAVLGGAGGAVSLAGAKLMQTGGPGLGSGLLGSQGAAGAGAGAAAGAAGRGGSMGMMGGMGGGGATEKKSRPGLSGLRAPQLEGDDDPAPRSEAAGAGGREF
ncbi:hypothetical protein [Microbacterium sp. ZW T5_56]|uniref:hypothetical protein n=1 Tax=Microbacterium sp. ZW T5_56 TaxID=3378081 RepID=UPI003853CADC